MQQHSTPTKRGRGRPAGTGTGKTKGQQCVWLTPSLAKDAKMHCLKNGVSFSEFVEGIILANLKKAAKAEAKA